MTNDVIKVEKIDSF